MSWDLKLPFLYSLRGYTLESYVPLSNPHEIHATKDHLKKTWERLISDHGHYLKRASQLGPNVARFVQILLERNLGFVDTRKIWGILSLDKNYSATEIDEACRMAVSMNSISFRTVQNILKLGSLHPSKSPNPTPASTTPVTPKFAVSIGDYKQQLDLLN